MARKRMIDPVYPFEKEIRQLSLPARYFYILSWCHMSDPNKIKNIVGGVLPYDPLFLHDNIFPGEAMDVQSLIDELITQNRYFTFKANGKDWLWCPTMAKHQLIQHPSGLKYPDPPQEMIEKYNTHIPLNEDSMRTHIPLNEDSMRTHIPLTQSRVELSRVELRKDSASAQAKTPVSVNIPVEKPIFSLETQDLMKKVYDLKFNIHSLLGRFHKELGYYLPEEVVKEVCNRYLERPEAVKNTWAWFFVSVKRACEAWFADQHVKESEASHKNDRDPAAIKDILAAMSNQNREVVNG